MGFLAYSERNRTVYHFIVAIVLLQISGIYGEYEINIRVEGGNTVLHGTTSTITCSFTKPAFDTVVTLTFSHGQQQDSLMQIANFFLYSTTPNPSYFNSFAPPDYVMTINNIDSDGTSGSSQLIIDSTSLEDGRRYWCQVAFLEDGSNPLKDVELTVIVPLRSITISTDGVNHTDGSLVGLVQTVPKIFTCVAQAGLPAATLSWTIANKPAIPDSENKETLNTDDPRLIDTASNKTVLPSWEDHHGRYVQCEGSQDGVSPVSFSSVKLDVKVPPSNVTQIKISDESQSGGYPNGSSAKVIEGTSNIITCDVYQTRPAAVIEWYIDNKKVDIGVTTPVPPSNTEDLVDTSGSLRLVPTRDEHKKILECRAKIIIDGAPGPIARSIVLEVNGPPDNPTLDGQHDLIEGTPQNFRCEATNAFPEGGIGWYNGDKNITETAASNVLDVTDSRYDISSTVNFTPNRRDNGNIIKCNVTHETLLGSDERMDSTMINVQFCAASVSITGSCPQDVLEGKPTDMTCSSTSSNPVTNLVWSKAGIPVENLPPPSYGDGENSGKTATLVYSSQFMRGETGIEIKCCGAIDSLSCNNCSTCSLNILYPPVKPEIIKTPIDDIIEGETVTLTCLTSGNPDPTITWRNSNSSQTPAVTAIDTLTLTDIKRDQAGYYYCVANNGYPPQAESDPEILVVHYIPEIKNKDDNRKSVDEGNDAVLECISQGNPEPNLMWFDQNGTIITNDRSRYTIEETRNTVNDEIVGTIIKSALMISGVMPAKDYGDFMCNASNYLGFENLTVTLNGLTLPENPANVKILKENSTTNSLRVQWKSGYNGGKPQWFVISYQEVNDDFPEMSGNVTEDKNQTVYIYDVIGLYPGLKYEIGVYSWNIIGSNEKDVQTASGITKPEPPKNIGIFFDMDDGTVTVAGLTDDNNNLTRLCLQLRQTADNLWVDWDCLNADVQSKPVLQAERYDQIRGALCVEDVCGEPSLGEVNEPADDVQHPQLPLIVGASIGGVILVAIIIALAVYLIRTSPTAKSKGSGLDELAMRNSTSGGLTNPSMNVPQESSTPTYAAVNKNKASTESNTPTYAAVNKKKASNGEQETDVYDDVANLNPASNGTKRLSNDGKTVNSDGLIYQEVGHFKSHPKDAPPIQTEASTEYASLDFNLLKAGKK